MKCLECSQELSNKWQIKFCSRTCSAIFNNNRRDGSKTVICHLCNNSFITQKHIIRKN
jgi:predicted nucleic acid-binding Zn ribbon protein